MDPPDRYFSFNRKVSTLAGLWSNQPHKERLLRYCVIGFMSVYNVCGELCQIYTLNMDLRAIVRSLQFFIPAMCGAVMYYNDVLHYLTLQKIYSFVQRDWQELRNDIELKIMQNHWKITKFVNFCLGLICHLYFIISIFPSLLRIIMSTGQVRNDIDHYPIISCIDYFLDRRTYYYPLVMYQIIGSFTLLKIAIASYTTYLAFIQHACARLSIIKYKIHSPFVANNNHNDDTFETQIDHTRWIIDIAEHLSRTKKFMTLVNVIAEKCYLLQMFLAFIILIIDFLCIFQIPALLVYEDNKRDVIELIFFIIGTFSLLYITCYMGQRLLDYSADVYREMCLVPFYRTSLKTQMLLLTTLNISAKPCIFSIGKVYVLSFEFFSSLLRSSLSFAMVLRSLQNI